MTNSRPRFTIRKMMVAIAILGVCLACPLIPVGLAFAGLVAVASIGATMLVLSPLIVVCYCLRNHHRDRYWGR